MADIDNFISNKWKSIFVFLSVLFHNSKIKQVRKKTPTIENCSKLTIHLSKNELQYSSEMDCFSTGCEFEDVLYNFILIN